MATLLVLLPPAATAGLAADEPLVITAEARWKFSGDDGATWTSRPPVVPGGKRVTLLARTRFQVPDPAAAGYWALTHNLLPTRIKVDFQLNDRDVPAPLKGMYYKTVPGVEAGLLKKGENVLTANIRIDNRRPRRRRGRKVLADYNLPLPRNLPTLAAPKLKIQTGPILGAFGKDYFTVACRTNVPTAVALYVCQTPARKLKEVGRSPLGLFHRFMVKDAPNRPDEYVLVAESGGRYEVAPMSRPVFPAKDLRVAIGTRYEVAPVIRPVFPTKDLRFVIMGDSRSRTGHWAKVAAAVVEEKPHFVIFNGDMCGHGTNDWEWDEHYLGPEPARKLLSTVPYYPVHGNHEENAPILGKLFYTPSPGGTALDWAQEIGLALFVAIDGRPAHGWRDTGWIEKVLSASKAKFIFFASHYPAYSSGNNGELEADGRPEDRGYRIARRALLPLLRKHKATALIVAHEHCYERSDLPGGLPQLCIAGAGAPLTSKRPEEVARRQNPYSKIYVKTLNYGLFQIEGDTCTYQAKTPEGKVIDTLTWKPRQVE